MTPISARLKGLAELQEHKAVEYGEGYKKFGQLMMELLGPIQINSATDYNRYMTYFNMVTKMKRYAKNFRTGHRGSTDDLAVYACILQELDDDMNDVPF